MVTPRQLTRSSVNRAFALARGNGCQRSRQERQAVSEGVRKSNCRATMVPTRSSSAQNPRPSGLTSSSLVPGIDVAVDLQRSRNQVARAFFFRVAARTRPGQNWSATVGSPFRSFVTPFMPCAPGARIRSSARYGPRRILARNGYWLRHDGGVRGARPPRHRAHRHSRREHSW